MTSTPNLEYAKTATKHWHRVQENTPLIHCVTNTVTKQIMANVLLAGGAAPAMVEGTTEAPLFSGIASALLINVGTFTAAESQLMLPCAKAAAQAGKPWVLDPVAVGPLPDRTRLAAELLAYKPAIIRGNASEILGLSQAAGGPGESSGRGVESGDEVEVAIEAANFLAEHCGATIAISGPIDLITDGKTTVRCANGVPMLTKVTGAGCALGAYLAAFTATNESPLWSAASAHASYGIAAEQAATHSAGPGSFAQNLLDELYNLSPAKIEKEAKLW